MSKQLTTRKTLLQLLFRLLFIVAPTIAIGYFTLHELNLSYTSFTTGIGKQALCFGLGIFGAYVLYFFRARFVLTFLIIFIIYWIIERIISRMGGEFDVFYIAVTFKLYSTLFIFGWIIGYLLGRIKYSHIIISLVFAIITVIANNQLVDFDLHTLLIHLFPVFGYAMYMLFIAPPLADSIDINFLKSGKNLLRSIVFLELVFLTFSLVREHFGPKLDASSKHLGEKHGPWDGGDDGDKGKKKPYDERKGLLERGNKGDKDGKGGKGGNEPDDGNGGNKPDEGDDGYKLKDTMKMSDKMSQADYVMFCAKLKNYFPDGSPKPLYFVYHYLTKYDPEKECFIRDTAMPYFDELNCDPSSLGMYRSKMDSTVIKNCRASKKRKTVEAQVYVSSNTWRHALLAPASAYYVQAIPVDSGYKKMFRSAYKVKSYTSELNNAYFVYNPSANPQLEEYQQERYDELRTVTDYKHADTSLFRYYTAVPKGSLYDSIKQLAKEITKDATTPVDKVIAIRDFFLQRDKEGNKIFRYTLTPGTPSDPNIPNASMLGTFIFKTHAGYCTYYAGASLFLLRSIGIPARFTTGFATIDRADKNKGWYWFYASQAHAWTQVYFPGYGWLDFDMTIGNDDQKDAPRPDGTPPLPPPEPWLVIDGKAETAPDLVSKRFDVSFRKIIFYNEDFRLNQSYTRAIDASVCRVRYGEKDTTLSCIKPGDSLIIVSYDDAAKVVPLPNPNLSMEAQLENFPKPIIADEIHIKVREEDRKKEEEKKKQQQKAKQKELTWGQILIRFAIVLGGIIVLIFLIPAFWFLWLLMRCKFANEPKKKADRVYRFGLYHFHMAGLEREHETPLQYATNKVDPSLRTQFTNFMQVYLRLKYANGQLMEGDVETVSAFGKSIRPAARKKIGFFKMIWNYLNIFRANRYFRRPEETKQEEQEQFL